MTCDREVAVVSIERGADAFQQPVAPEVILAICRRALGSAVVLGQVTEIGIGTYNNTYRVDVQGREPVILRVAPRPALQGAAGKQAMRNEYAALPFLAPLGVRVPRTIAVDFTHQLLDRDYLVQTLLPGTPASERIASYSPSALRQLYRELGSVTRTLHEVSGEVFGPVAGPFEASWSEALTVRFHELAADFPVAGLPTDDVYHVIDSVNRHRAVLDEITTPSLLHGDLWTLNILVDADPERPTITGVLDCDAAYWGDPMSDWTINQVLSRSGTEVDAFWETYGARPQDPASSVRALFYRARNVLGARLDIQRRGLNFEDIPPIHWDLTDVLSALR
ncbi:MAG: aminoglycoside phosphotransferase family protein [Actinomycetota bacterium]|nr:aminoglycoside phosphotransferase family protein [Actinomycetota bacterium]MDQ2955714.1 aminoglycoside phosphotransferase family protein [Actinomycetota bacterium]